VDGVGAPAKSWSAHPVFSGFRRAAATVRNVADDAALPLELGRSGEHDVALLAVLLAAHAARGDGSHSFIAGEDAQKPLQDLDSLTDGLFRCSSARIASLLQRPPQPLAGDMEPQGTPVRHLNLVFRLARRDHRVAAIAGQTGA
jgi:hypothetical protein